MRGKIADRRQRFRRSRKASIEFLTSGHTRTHGHIVGTDAGYGKRQEQPRNSLCACGSGKKSKKCCGAVPYSLLLAMEVSSDA